MAKNKPKTTNGLMNYLRDEKCINIGGSIQKRKLMNMGYYHGYKGYRYINSPTNRIQFSDFEELSAIYNYDSQIKALFYPYRLLSFPLLCQIPRHCLIFPLA